MPYLALTETKRITVYPNKWVSAPCYYECTVLFQDMLKNFQCNTAWENFWLNASSMSWEPIAFLSKSKAKYYQRYRAVTGSCFFVNHSTPFRGIVCLSYNFLYVRKVISNDFSCQIFQTGQNCLLIGEKLL
jgi:hypothetical protein